MAREKRLTCSFERVKYGLTDLEGTEVYAVNGEQYKILLGLEGQSIITTHGVAWISNVASRLKKCPGIRRNYIFGMLVKVPINARK